MKQFEVVVIESHRCGYLVSANSEHEARKLIENADRDYSQTFDEYNDLESIESVTIDE